jgi:hypothetical protein
MLNATDLILDGKFLAEHIDAATPTASDLTAALTTAKGAHLAALAIIASERALTETIAPLLTMLDTDGVAGKAIAWALGRLATASNGVEAKALAALADGGLDVRENAYAILAGLAAQRTASANLGDAMAARVLAEIERARGGGSGLGEHACRVLAVLGDERTTTLIQQVIEQDRFCDRFELQRLRKTVQDDGRDQESIKALKAGWKTTFADFLFVPKVAEPLPEKTPLKTAAAKSPAPKIAGAGSIGKPNAPRPPAPPAPAPMTDAPLANDGSEADEMDEGIADAEGDEAPGQPQPIDWPAFVSSPEAQTLPAPLQQLAGQLGPLLEQLSMRAIRAPLVDLSGQEFAGLLLQLLPQALPPQHVQMALSPQAMTCYKVLIKFLIRTGQTTKGEEMLDAIGMVRKELTNQIRQAGILNGPDYSDPDDKPAVPKA